MTPQPSVLDALPPKQAAAGAAPPAALFPLTRANMRTALPRVVHAMLSHNIQQLPANTELMQRLYSPDAVFEYPAARLRGRHAALCFWQGFLVGRKLQLLDVHSLRVDVLWDPEQLQAYMQLEAWQRSTPWLDWLTGLPGWKVWSSQLLRFEECPPAPAAPQASAAEEAELRLVWQEELSDQSVFLGTLPLGLYTIRADPGTPLCWLLDALRDTTGWLLAACMPVMVRLLAALGVF